MDYGLWIDYLIIIRKITIEIAKKINFLVLKNDEDFVLNVEDPHLEQTILPPKDRSETNEALPQLEHTLFTFIDKNFQGNLFRLYCWMLCKEKQQNTSW